jgi:hypothetical protein
VKINEMASAMENHPVLAEVGLSSQTAISLARLYQNTADVVERTSVMTAKNPIQLLDKGRFTPGSVIDQIAFMPEFKKYEQAFMMIVDMTFESTTESFREGTISLQRILEKEGYDSIAYVNLHEPVGNIGQMSYITWKPDSTYNLGEDAVSLRDSLPSYAAGAIVAGGALAATDEAEAEETKGIRSNNPFNIEKSDAPFQGKVANEGRFEGFKTPFLGIRAGAVNTITQFEKRGLNTVQGLVSRHAPEHENPTDAFIQFVSKRLGVEPGEVIDITNEDTLVKYVNAIIHFENGGNPFDASLVREAVQDARQTKGL